MTFFNKLKWILGILVVFLLIISTNLIDKNNFERVKESVQTIYEDRLIAKDIIFDMMDYVHQKEMALIKQDSNFYKTENLKVETGLSNLLTRFENTKLTQNELKIFEKLTNDLQELNQLELKYQNSNYQNSKQLKVQLEKVKQDLNDLSDIQIDEGGRQLSISKKALQNVELFTQLEIYILIFLAIVIQIIVIYRPKQKSE